MTPDLEETAALILKAQEITQRAQDRLARSQYDSFQEWASAMQCVQSSFTELIVLTNLVSLNLKTMQKMLPKRWDNHGSN